MTSVSVPPTLPDSPTSPRRSCLVTLLAVAVLIIAGWNLLRLSMTIWQWSFLTEYAEIPRFYLALSGAFWFVTGLFVSGALWLLKPWAAKALIWFSLAYIVYFWVDRLFVRGINTNSWVLPTLGSLLWLGFVFLFARKFYRVLADGMLDMPS